MIKIVIVDDEILVRKGLKTTIDWNKYGFDIVGEADNGLKALEVVKDTYPDVVLVDIRMPKMDGLTFIKELKYKYPKIKTIILSCYNDFEYVREALRLGAMDYIPKLSMENEDLIKILNSVKDKIEKERSKYNEVLELQEFVKNNFYDIRSKYFNDILDSKSFINISDNKLKLLKIDLRGDIYIILCLKFDSCYVQQFKLSNIDIINFIEKGLITNNLYGDVFYRNDKEFIILIRFLKERVEVILNKVKEFSKNLVILFKQYIGMSVSLGVSNIFRDIKNIKESYKEANLAVELRFYKGSGTIAYYSNIPKYEDKTIYDKVKKKEIKSALEENKLDEVKKIIFNLFEHLNVNQNILPLRVKEDFKDIIYIFGDVIKQFDGDIENIKDKNGNKPEESIDSCITLNELKLFFNDFIDDYIKYIIELKEQKYSKTINRIIDYIKLHYMDFITLVDVAKHVNMNESYLCYLFKKETGTKFTEYLNNIRIEKAKELLREEDLNVYEVAEKVGFVNASYFSKLFKSQEGVNPITYKKKYKNNFKKTKNSVML